jgi:hypothetical protein
LRRVDIDKIIDELPPDMTGEAPTPAAAAHPFQVNPEAEKLDAERKKLFHCNVAKLLFLSKCTRPDLQIAVACLCTRVKDADEDNYKKL